MLASRRKLFILLNSAIFLIYESLAALYACSDRVMNDIDSWKGCTIDAIALGFASSNGLMHSIMPVYEVVLY